MRLFCAVVCLGLTGLTFAQDRLAKRYGLDVSAEKYPQKTPQEAMQSVVKAMENRRPDYVLAHLADPEWVDRTVADYKVAIARGKDEARTAVAFDRLVRETSQYLLEDPSVLRELRQFAKEADWETKDNAAIGTVKSIEGRKVFLKKLEDRWFLENKQQ